MYVNINVSTLLVANYRNYTLRKSGWFQSILVASVSYLFPHDWTILIAKYSSMTSTNDLESQLKFLACLESKAGSGTPLCLTMQTSRRKLK